MSSRIANCGAIISTTRLTRASEALPGVSTAKTPAPPERLLSLCLLHTAWPPLLLLQTKGIPCLKAQKARDTHTRSIRTA